MITTHNTMSLARAVRSDLAELPAALTSEQREPPSVCADWRVHDVVAHMFSGEDFPRPGSSAECRGRG